MKLPFQFNALRPCFIPSCFIRCWALAAVAVGLLQPATQAQTISTTAGVGGQGFSGPATSSPLNIPYNTAVDGDGNLYIAEYDRHRIRKVTPEGTISTVAGTGNMGYNGDEGLATNAQLNQPSDVTIDSAGNLYIADTQNHRIRRVDASTQIIVTVAGTGKSGALVTGNDGDGGLATNALLASPAGVAVDSAGTVLYIADTWNQRIRKIQNGTIVTVAGTGQLGGYSDGSGVATNARVYRPSGVAIDAAGSLYIADTYNHIIRRVMTDGTISTVAGTSSAAGYSGDTGLATSAQLNFPNGVAVDGSGNLFIADTENHRIRKVIPTGTISTVAGTGVPGFNNASVAVNARLNSPRGVAVDGGANLLIVDTNNYRIRKVSSEGIISTVAGNGTAAGDGKLATGAELYAPSGLVFDATGNLYIADTENQRIRKVTPDGIISTVAGTGVAGFSGGDGGLATATNLSDPHGVAVDTSGNVYIADSDNDRILMVVPSGFIYTVAGTGVTGSSGDGGPAVNAKLNYPSGVAVDTDGLLYIADTLNHRIRRVQNSIITTVAGTGEAGGSGTGEETPATSAPLNQPNGVAIDANGDLYIADTVNGRIRKLKVETATIVTVAGGFEWPRGVTVDVSSNVYIADTLNHRIRKIAPNGTASTLAGTEVAGYGGDAGKSADAQLNSPYGVAVDTGGNAYIADTLNHRIRKVTDARADVVWRNASTGANTIWKSAVSATSQAMATVSDTNWKIVGTGDYSGDGTADLLWRHSGTGANTIWRSALSTSSQSVSTVSDQTWKVAGSGDFNADGAADLVWRNSSTGSNTIWRSANSATTQPVTAVTDQTWQIVGVGDFDKNGASDLLWRNSVSGKNTIWRSGDSAAQQAVTQVGDTAWKIVGVGDLDGDGSSDILWRNTSTGANTVWRSANSATTQPVTAVTDQAWKVAAVSDVDDDGQDDIVWRHDSTGANAVWRSGNSATPQSMTAVGDSNWKIVGIGGF